MRQHLRALSHRLVRGTVALTGHMRCSAGEDQPRPTVARHRFLERRNSSMSKWSWLRGVGLPIAAAILLPSVSRADQVGGTEIVVPEEEVIVEKKPPPCDCPKGPNLGNVSISAGLDVATAYFFRGILQERDGGIFWPYAEIAFKLWDNGEGQNISIYGGTWNSVQTNKTLASGSGPSNWYEADVYGGLRLGLADFLLADLQYRAYTYPNGSFPTVQEFDATLKINDSQWMPEHFSTTPYMLWAFELDNTALGNDEGIYLELGAKPAYVFASDSDYPVTASLPLALGLSVNDYYDTVRNNGTSSNDTFGYFDAGFDLSVPLSFIPTDYGTWSVHAAIHGIALSGALADIDREDGFFPWGVAGIAMTY